MSHAKYAGVPSGKCQVCQHPEVARINYLCCRTSSISALARQFKINHCTLRRHSKLHIALDFRRAVQLGPFASEESLRKVCAENGQSVLESLRAIYGGLSARWLANFEAGADAPLAVLTKEMHRNLTLTATLTRELAPTPSTVINNVFSLPIFIDLESTLLRVLAQYPEARAAVIRAFYEIEKKEQAKAPLIEVKSSEAA